jgi:prefoldin subunit 5
MIPADEMNKWNEAVRVAAERDRLRDEMAELRVELKEARKCIADIRAMAGAETHERVILRSIQERLDEYAGT